MVWVTNGVSVQPPIGGSHWIALRVAKHKPHREPEHLAIGVAQCVANDRRSDREPDPRRQSL